MEKYRNPLVAEWESVIPHLRSDSISAARNSNYATEHLQNIQIQNIHNIICRYCQQYYINQDIKSITISIFILFKNCVLALCNKITLLKNQMMGPLYIMYKSMIKYG
jgi:hypothetical protein